MKKAIIVSLCVLAVALFAARVRMGALALDVDSSTTTALVGYMPPNSVVSSVDVIVGVPFNAQSNKLLSVFSVTESLSNFTKLVTTNTFIASYSLAATNSITAPFAAASLYMTKQPKAAVPVYATYSQTGTNANVGAARVVVTYIQY